MTQQAIPHHAAFVFYREEESDYSEVRPFADLEAARNFIIKKIEGDGSLPECWHLLMWEYAPGQYLTETHSQMNEWCGDLHKEAVAYRRDEERDLLNRRT